MKIRTNQLAWLAAALILAVGAGEVAAQSNSKRNKGNSIFKRMFEQPKKGNIRAVGG